MEDSDEKTLINLIKQNADQNKIKSIIQTLYKKGNTDFINKYLSEKRTPLIWAITNKNIDIVKLLIENQADVNREDGALGWKPIHYAAIYEIESILNVLIYKEAELNELNKKKQTALHLAVSKNKVIATKLLTSTNKIKINITDEYGQTALIKSCSTNSEMCSLLLLEYPDIHLNIQDIHGNTALHYSSEEGNYKVSLLIIKKGIDCRIKNIEGKQAFELLKDKEMKNLLINYAESVKNGVAD